MKKSKKSFITFLSFLLSLTLHAGIFGGIGYLSGVNFKNIILNNEKKEIFSIETIENYSAKDLPDISKIKAKNNINQKNSQENKKIQNGFSLENKNVKVISSLKIEEESLNFENAIKLKIQKARNYPEKARQEGIEGDILLSFEVLRKGELGNILIIKSSGFEILDNEAINTLKRAAPFPEIPEYYNLQKINLQVRIIYKLN